jgi:BirA family biotin operon repressor/biotin-[acetyl-CoA-carboxylase] ligase
MPPADPLDPDRIRQNLKIRSIGKQLLVFESTASTNDVAAEYARNPANHGLVVLAEHQTAGKGRAANQWLSEPRQSILCSILLTECRLNPELLSLTIAVAAAEAIGKTGRHHAQIKWPNDILLNNKKVAGILLESKPFPNYTARIIGIGINCRQNPDDFPDHLRPTATSLDIESAAPCDRTSVIKRLLTAIDHWLEKANHNPADPITHWQKLSTQLHHTITVIHNDKRFTGTCIGIDPQKGLILHLDSGATRFFPAAQTSILKPSQ